MIRACSYVEYFSNQNLASVLFLSSLFRRFHARSVLATARALDPSAYLRNVPTNDAASVAKVLVSFVQIMATTPMALVVRHSDSLRSFLGGLDIANFSAPKVIMVTDDFDLFAMYTIIGSVQVRTTVTLLVVAGYYIKKFARRRDLLQTYTWKRRGLPNSL